MTRWPAEDVAGLIVAGGEGRRMGQIDKALLDVGGRALIDRILEPLWRVCSEVVAVVRDPSPFEGKAVRLVRDRLTGIGPLAGFDAGLAVLHRPVVLAVAGDLPFLSVPLLQRLIGELQDHSATVPVWEGRPQPLCAAYARTDAARALAAHLEGPDRSLMGWLDRLPDVRWIQQPELEAIPYAGQSFIDLDTPADLRRAQELAPRATAAPATDEPLD